MVLTAALRAACGTDTPVCAVAPPERRQECLLHTAETLAYGGRFAEAEAIYRTLPPSRAAALGLARVVLWSGRYAEARSLFLAMGDDPEAIEGAATAAYWQGDWRTASREYTRVASRETAARALGDIAAATRPAWRFVADAVDDDQPFHAQRGEAVYSFFSDELTRWDASAGTYRLASEVPFALVRNERVFPWQRATLTTTLGAIRYPGSGTRAIGGIALRLRQVTLSIQDRELLTNPADRYGSLRTTSLRWETTLAAAGVQHLRYFDGNEGDAADAYVLRPIAKRGQWRILGGVSAAFRDTEQTRFFATAVSSAREGDAFRYSYRGLYIPYWTPQNLVEGRAIVAVERASRVTTKLQVDAGRARDRAVGFGPDLGTTPLPPDIFSFTFPRTFTPWRARFTASTNLGALAVDFAYEHSVTAEYRANSFHASVGRRR